jgi:hypothetical protein
MGCELASAVQFRQSHAGREVAECVLNLLAVVNQVILNVSEFRTGIGIRFGN